MLTFHEYSYIPGVVDAVKSAAVETSHKFIVINNGDPKEEVAEIFRPIEHPSLYLFHMKNNKGFPGGCNIGAQKGQAPYILLLNSDVMLYPDAIDIMMKKMEEDKTIGAIGPLLIFPENPDSKGRPTGRVQHAGIEMAMDSTLTHTFLGWTPDHPKVTKEREPFALTGACLLTRRSIWNNLGGLFKGYGLGTVEDVDYCMGVKKLGKRIVYCPEAKGYHYTGASAEKAQQSFPIQENMGLFYHRWQDKFEWSEWKVL